MLKCKTYPNRVVMFRLLIMVSVSCLVAIQAAAMDKASVLVEFEMPDKKYTDEFEDSKLPGILKDIASAIAQELQKKIVYLKFAQEAESPYKLIFRLDRADAYSGRRQREFGFHVTLSGPDIRRSPQTYWVFRGADRYGDKVGRLDELIKEIQLNIRQDAAITHLVGNVLRHVSFTQDATFSKPLSGWFIAYSRSDLCMDFDSLIALRNNFPWQGGSMRDDFNARVKDFQVGEGSEQIFGEAEEDPQKLKKLLDAAEESIKVEKVYVLEYRYFCPPQPVPPGEANFGDEGNQQ